MSSDIGRDGGEHASVARRNGVERSGVWSALVSRVRPTVDRRPPRVDPDDAFEVIRNRRRRYTIHALAQSDGSVPIGDLAERVAAWENETERTAVTSEERRRVYNALQQVHLPKMDEFGVIEYDFDRGTVRATERTARVRSYLESLPPGAVPWRASSVLLAVAFLVGGAVAAGLPPFASIPPVLGVVVPAVAVVAVAGTAARTVLRYRVGRDGSPPECR